MFLTCNYLFYFLATPQDFRILVFRPEMEPRSLVVKVLIPSHWTARESLNLHLSNKEWYWSIFFHELVFFVFIHCILCAIV